MQKRREKKAREEESPDPSGSTTPSRSSSSSRRRPATEAVHRGERDDPTGAIVTPVYHAATFRLREKEYEALAKDEYDHVYIYTRWGNPTLDVAADKIASLEGADNCLLYGSGMGAISGAVLAHLSKGDLLVASRDLYGGTIPFFKHLPRFGIDVKSADQTSVGAVAGAARGGAKAIYVETITNPLLRIAPLPELAKVAREAGAALIVDNTFASPANCRPLEHGADVAVESCTKYLGGHADIIAGSAAYRKSRHKTMWEMMIRLGATLDPNAAFLLNRGIKTLGLRVRRHNENALAIAEFLSDREDVEGVIYPGLTSHPQHRLASSLLDGFGGMLTFVLKGGDQAARRFQDALEVVGQAPSLGMVESVVTMPVHTSHVHVRPEERKAMGIVPGMVRMSVGIEDPEDLKEDLAAALKKL